MLPPLVVAEPVSGARLESDRAALDRDAPLLSGDRAYERIARCAPLRLAAPVEYPVE